MAKRRIALRMEKGGIVPADADAIKYLREQGYKVGQVVMAELSVPRNLPFHQLAHRLGGLFVTNIEAFHGLDAHDALKKIQLDAGIECDETVTDIPGFGRLISHKARSMAFDKMEQAQFYAFVKAACQHISDKYWPSMTAMQIAAMADCMVGDD